MGLVKSLHGTIMIEVISADTSSLVQSINNLGIALFDVIAKDDLTITAEIYRIDLAAVQNLIERRGEKLRISRRSGVYWLYKRLFQRPVLIIGAIIFLILALYLPTRIFFVRVEGNTQLPERLILEQGNECGISFGASRKEVRSEKVKNALIGQLPQLQWVGVNTHGCVAVISVRERSETSAEERIIPGVSSIIASRDGIITHCTVERGTALCQVGQAVKEGDVLVSGYTDCGISIQAARAKAEIYALTLRNVEVYTLSEGMQRQHCSGSVRRYSLRFGKKIINFSKDSGISGASCVKIYKENYFTLPGGFRLPVALITETISNYDTTVTTISDAPDWLAEYTAQYLCSQMVAGQIQTEQTFVENCNELFVLNGKYACIEMIGKTKEEEIFQQNGEGN